MKLKILYIALSVYLLNVLYEVTQFVSDGSKKYWFLTRVDFGAWDGRMTLENYVYMYDQHIVILTITYALGRFTEYKTLFNTLFLLECADMFFAAFNYNADWFQIGLHGVDINDIKILAILILIWKEWNSGK